MSMKCVRCNKSSKITLKYLGKGFCNSCFKRLIEKRIRKTIGNSKPLGDDLLILSSGGYESEICIKVLRKLLAHSKTKISLLAVDSENKKILSRARALAGKYGVEFKSTVCKRDILETATDFAKSHKALLVIPASLDHEAIAIIKKVFSKDTDFSQIGPRYDSVIKPLVEIPGGNLFIMQK